MTDDRRRHDDDDLSLGSMRSMLRSLGDEDPPDTGMAALLAAARAKAVEMAPPPSRWQRVVARICRPPVLALASVAVLIGVGLLATASRGSEPDAALPAVTLASEESVRLSSSSVVRESAPPPAGPPSAAATGRDVVAAAPALRTSPQPTEQLVKQCEHVAAIGDCTATQIVAKQLADVDHVEYALLVKRNPAVARCLEPSGQ